MPTVWIPTAHGGNGRHVYHTDPDCYQLNNANTVKPIDRDKLYEDLEECDTCAGTARREQRPDYDSLAARLQNDAAFRQRIIDTISRD